MEAILLRLTAAAALMMAASTLVHAETYSPEVARNLDGLLSKCAYMSNDPKAPACIEYKATLARTIPPQVQVLMHQEEGLDDKCRNGAPPKTLPNGQYPPDSFCGQREQLIKTIRQHGWCWGHTDMDSYHPGWVICHAVELE